MSLAKIKLKNPVSAHDNEITELEFREPTGADLMSLPLEFEGSGYKPPTIELASMLAGVPTSTIKSLCAEDAIQVMKVVNPFIAECLGTLGS